ncbi:hypothetical protein NA57DRAFT_74289 [Rhizodiscina lignyota]|uniref:PHD-type domain-containing protein n=1 Tax=Rhizodiscina lignyota TaxID=1504668 RepID=A0A9P4M7H0_9PEZI|nr:hypothetical protein NA57DRAFT_74289 [Rhizodiscina lignyota]
MASVTPINSPPLDPTFGLPDGPVTNPIFPIDAEFDFFDHSLVDDNPNQPPIESSLDLSDLGSNNLLDVAPLENDPGISFFDSKPAKRESTAALKKIQDDKQGLSNHATVDEHQAIVNYALVNDEATIDPKQLIIDQDGLDEDGLEQDSIDQDSIDQDSIDQDSIDQGQDSDDDEPPPITAKWYVQGVRTEVAYSCRAHCAHDDSWAEMIACDNVASHGFEEHWWHLPCAPVRTVPPGDWFCKPCRRAGHIPSRKPVARADPDSDSDSGSSPPPPPPSRKRNRPDDHDDHADDGSDDGSDDDSNKRQKRVKHEKKEKKDKKEKKEEGPKETTRTRKEEVAKRQTKQSVQDRSKYPNPVVGDSQSFYGTPPASGQTDWSEAEQKACIFQMRRLAPHWDGARDLLWYGVSEEMAREGISRSQWAVKNWWNRFGRARSGLDERVRPRTTTMRTGLLVSQK